METKKMGFLLILLLRVGKNAVMSSHGSIPILDLPPSCLQCMDPNTIESKVMVSSTGHDGPMGASGVKRLQKLGMVAATQLGEGRFLVSVKMFSICVKVEVSPDVIKVLHSQAIIII